MKWQPIETAPRDGTLILVWRASEARIAKWGEQNGYYFWCDQDGNMLSQPWKHDSGKPDDWQIPTHWMPLPKSPKGER